MTRPLCETVEPTLCEATIAQLRDALDSGRTTSVALTLAYLRRIAVYDRGALRLNAVCVLDPRVLDEARRSDELRAAGVVLGPLHGIPFTVKDSYKVAGLTVAAGATPFLDLVADEDAFAVEKLRAAGAILLGKTTMPPMADGGVQRGAYGRAESPYNSEYLTAAWGSGSSNGSGTATAANFAAFGMAEETLSSGRSPASNNSLVAYTPSWGLISIRGNWPLWPTRDVVVPHTRTVSDLLELVDVLVVDDDRTDGDFWRSQNVIPVPTASQIRTRSLTALADPNALAGTTLGVPKMYIGRDPDSTEPVAIRSGVRALWEQTADELRSLGATVVEVDLPVVSNSRRDRPGTRTLAERGILPAGWEETEALLFPAIAMERFLRSIDERPVSSWSEIDPAAVFPEPIDLEGRPEWDMCAYYGRIVDLARSGLPDFADVADFAAGLRGVRRGVQVEVTDWMDELGLDAIVLPAAMDIAAATADRDIEANRHAMTYGTITSTMETEMRQFGLPSVTVPMGVLPDIGMPVGVTFAGRPYDDERILSYAYSYEYHHAKRIPPPNTPPLPNEDPAATPGPGPRVEIGTSFRPGSVDIEVTAVASSSIVEFEVTCNDVIQRVPTDSASVVSFSTGTAIAAGSDHDASPQVVIVARARDDRGRVDGAVAVVHRREND